MVDHKTSKGKLKKAQVPYKRPTAGATVHPNQVFNRTVTFNLLLIIDLNGNTGTLIFFYIQG